MTDALRVTGKILVGPDEVRDEMWVIGGRVSFTPPTGVTGITTMTLTGWVLPGLVDAHCHIGLDAHGAVDDTTTEQQALTDRDTGVLLVRDAGSPADTRWIDQREDLPRVVRAGRHIARTKRYIRNFAWEIEPDELVAHVVQEARRGDGWVKIVGDWIDREVGDLAPCWPFEVVREAIAAAHAEGARVTAHCFSEDSIGDLARAGIDCVEHATGLTDETIPLFAEHGVAIVPTLINIDRFPHYAEAGAEKFPRYATHMRALHARRYETIRAAYEAGIAIYAGTDAGGSLPHGLIAGEVVELVRAGIPATEALEAACWRARAWLGRPGLTDGASADFAVYPEDPRLDVGVLAHPATVVLRGHPVS
jgi:imidazolonepropionase-like amidohydrolase